MPLPNQFWWSEAEEQLQFLNVLQHDRHNGNVIRFTLGADENLEPRHFANKDVKKVMYLNPNKNAYVSLNSFKGYKRVSEDVWNYTSIYIDLDGHNYAEDELEAAILRTKEVLGKAVDNKEILLPTMMTATGRGLGIYYVFERSIANVDGSQKAIKFMKDIQNLLYRKYSEILSEKGLLEVDPKVQDPSRVVRMPGSFNIKANKICRLLFVGTNKRDKILYYSLNDIVQGCHLDAYFAKRIEARAEQRKKKIVYIDAYRLPFLTLRMQKLESLQELREYDCRGYREYMCFIYYNAAVQVLGSTEGSKMLEQFNNAFNEPISDKEIEHIIHVVESNEPSYGGYKGYYKLPDRYILETLEITEDENKVCRFGQSKRQIEREQTKEKNRLEKLKRADEIIKYVVDNPSVKYADIGSIFGISEATVKRILSNNNIHRYERANATVDRNSKAISVKKAQKMTESLVGVLSVAGDSVHNPSWMVEITHREELLQEYARLYKPIIEEYNSNKPIKGQLSFSFSPDGSIEFFESGIKKKEHRSSS